MLIKFGLEIPLTGTCGITFTTSRFLELGRIKVVKQYITENFI